MESWVPVIAGILVAIACLAGVLLTVIRLPGTWLIVAAALGYGWWFDWTRVGLTLVLILTGAAVLGELVELFASLLVSRRASASRKSAWGGLIGGFVGMMILAMPIPVVGIVIGALLGCFTGAMLGELLATRNVTQGARVGVFAAIGFAVGAAAKLAISMAMAGVLLAAVVLSSAPQASDDISASLGAAQRLLCLCGANSSSGPIVRMSVEAGHGAMR